VVRQLILANEYSRTTGADQVLEEGEWKSREDSVFNTLLNQWKQSAAGRGPVANWSPENPAWLTGGRVTAVRGGSWGLDGNPNRDLDKECGYISAPGPSDYSYAYARVGLAARYVNIWPDECWAAYPTIYEQEDPKNPTPWETALAALVRKTLLLHYMHRIDRLSGVGRFGVLLLGLDDGADPATPVASYNRDGTVRKNARTHNLLYVRALGEEHCFIEEIDADVRSWHFGQPLYYSLRLGGDGLYATGGTGQEEVVKSVRVHWTRVVHVADNREASEVHGVPRLQNVINIITDVRKVAGSSAEMFWKGGFPGYAFTTYPEFLSSGVIDKATIRTEMSAYQNGLQRFLSAVGGEWKSLSPQVADPKSNLDQQIAMLCATGGIPVPVFLGMQTGHLAGTENTTTWKERLGGRQANYVEPFLVRPVIDRLMDLGCLPRAAEYFVSWRDLKSLGDKDKAEIGLKRIQALMQYVTGDVNQVMPLRLALTLCLGFSDTEAKAVEKELVANKPEPMTATIAKATAVALPAQPAPAAKPQGGGRKGTPTTKKNGRPKGKVEGKP